MQYKGMLRNSRAIIIAAGPHIDRQFSVCKAPDEYHQALCISAPGHVTFLFIIWR